MFEAAPENRLILAKYEDITAQHTARVNEIGEEFAQQLAQADAEAAERARIAAEQLPEIEREHEAARAEALKAEQEAAPKPTWARQERRTVLSFGGEDDEPVAQPAPAAPRPPVVAPEPAPPPPESRRVLSFGLEDDEAAAPRRPGRARHAAPDDEDWSGQSWMR